MEKRILGKINEFRKQERKIYYMDETWVNEGPSAKKLWQDVNVENAKETAIEGWSTGLKILSGKGRHLIITHIGSDSGFELSKTGDYDEEMNAEVYEKWFRQITENLEPAYVVVMDNASYHSRHFEKTPRQAWIKAQIQEWLRIYKHPL